MSKKNHNQPDADTNEIDVTTAKAETPNNKKNVDDETNTKRQKPKYRRNRFSSFRR